MAVYTALLQGPWACERRGVGSADWNWNPFEFWVKTEHHEYFKYLSGTSSYWILCIQSIPGLQVLRHPRTLPLTHPAHPYISQRWGLTQGISLPCSPQVCPFTSSQLQKHLLLRVKNPQVKVSWDAPSPPQCPWTSNLCTSFFFFLVIQLHCYNKAAPVVKILRYIHNGWWIAAA